ncbi:hypothetical protein [Marinobacter sp. JSM 1782161]|uniref:hypothetical protein n=1 Tax=Marinobacter sp. JSM 1782161 TaxID=2685906 RepID=UPI001402ABF9|nr:hypothetical protein [Marinobacter sp. JSM 1782161]
MFDLEQFGNSGFHGRIFPNDALFYLLEFDFIIGSKITKINASPMLAEKHKKGGHERVRRIGSGWLTAAFPTYRARLPAA